MLVLSCQLFRDDPVWGMLILSLGAVTMFLGAVLALFSNNLKKTLACSSMSQIGFILTGIGTMGLLGRENALAGAGVLLHMVNHSLFKLVLFMCAGVVFMNTEALELNRIRGFGRKKPLLHACFLLGAAGIGGIPGLSGYISKTLLHEGIVEAAAEYGLILHAAEWIFLLSGGKLTVDDVPMEILCAPAGEPPPQTVQGQAATPPKGAGSPATPPAQSLADAERDKILAVLASVGGNKTKAAEILGISRRTIHRKMVEWGVS